MTGLRLFLSGRGLHIPWLLAQAGIAVGALGIAWLRVGSQLNPDMIYSDESQLLISLGILASSALSSWLLVPEVGWREHTASQSLWGPRVVLVVIVGVTLCWPWLAPGTWALQHVALGVLLCGASGLLARWKPALVSLPQVVALLLALIPKLLPPQWNPLMPTQRGIAFLLVAATMALAGAVATVTAAATPAKTANA